jgi:hypothetical protein
MGQITIQGIVGLIDIIEDQRPIGVKYLHQVRCLLGERYLQLPYKLCHLRSTTHASSPGKYLSLLIYQQHPACKSRPRAKS